MTEAESRALRIGSEITFVGGPRRLLGFVERADNRYVWMRYENGNVGLMRHEDMKNFVIGWHAHPEGAT